MFKRVFEITLLIKICRMSNPLFLEQNEPNLCLIKSDVSFINI